MVLPFFSLNVPRSLFPDHEPKHFPRHD